MSYRKIKKDHVPVTAGAEFEAARFPEVIREVESGGTVLEWCQAEGISYASVWQWVNAHGDRASKLQSAEMSRKGAISDLFIRELRNISDSDIRLLYGDDGQLKNPNKWPEKVGRLVRSISYDKNGEISKVEFWSKISGLQMVGKSLGLLDSSADKKLDTLAELLKSRQELLEKKDAPEQ